MPKHRIGWLPGDGIGPRLLGAARRVLDRLDLDIDYLPAEIGQAPWATQGDPIPPATQETLRFADCSLLGALAGAPPDGSGAEEGGIDPLRRLRTDLHLFTNVRHCRALPGHPANRRDDIDITLFRENVEDVHSGVEWFPVPKKLYELLKASHPRMERYQATPWDEIAITCRIVTREGCRGILEAALEEARRRELDGITVVEHPRVMAASSGLMLREARRMAATTPGLELREMAVDVACRELLRRPEEFGVVVTTNLFGELLSEVCGSLVGGPGVGAESNLGDASALFRPTLGPEAAPDPLGTVRAAARMLAWLGEAEASRRVDAALASVVRQVAAGELDPGGSTPPEGVADAVAAAL